MSISLALVLLVAPQAAPAPVDTVQIAMTRGGVRIEVEQAPAVGAVEFPTPFGMYYTPRDPVALVLESPRRAPWRDELTKDPEMSLAPTIAALDSDGRIDELLQLMPVLEARLHEDELSRAAEQRRDELIAATRALEAWGARLDPLSGDLDREERIEELWKRSRKAKGAHALLPGARLTAELAPLGGVGDFQLSISDVRDGMRAKNPFLRRTTSLIHGKQMFFDGAQNTLVLLASIEDAHPAARDGAAAGIVQTWPGQAREYWIDILLRWTDRARARAAWHLVQHLPQEAAGPVVGAVAASDERVSKRFDVGDLTLTVVTSKRRPSEIFFDGGVRIRDRGGIGVVSDVGECVGGVAVTGTPGQGVTNGANAGHVPRGLTNGSSAKITKLSPALTEALQRALDELVDDGSERDRAAWIAWYEDQVEARTAQQP